MCAFLSRPHQANPHLYRNKWRPRTSSTFGVRAGRRSNDTFYSTQKILPLPLRKVVQIGSSCLSSRELSRRSLSNFVMRSIPNRGLHFLRVETIETSSTSDLAPTGTEISNLYYALSDSLKDVTAMDILSFTFVSVLLGTMGAYVMRELKNYKENSMTGEYNRQSNHGGEYLSTPLLERSNTNVADEWLNLSKPSPFNLAVSARCPSLSSLPSDKYFQRLVFKAPEYQRQCLPSHDGGTVALDWPSHLDIDGSTELENVLLFICGTTEGSHEYWIGQFSQLVEQHGYFPIIFNPRGCGGSPVTTPRQVPSSLFFPSSPTGSSAYRLSMPHL